jgi:hypothetical protein
MAAPKGHEKWGNPIKPKKYQPLELWDKAIEYFEHNLNNPWIKKEVVKSGMHAGEVVDLEIQRPYSIEAFCLFAKITYQTFQNYSKEKGYETYFEVCKRVREIIDTQHFEGGMVGEFNSNLTARKLGLTDKQDHKHEIKSFEVGFTNESDETKN